MCKKYIITFNVLCSWRIGADPRSTISVSATGYGSVLQVVVTWNNVQSSCNTLFNIYYFIMLCSTMQISLVHKVYHKYRKQTLPLRYLGHTMALNRRHDFTQDPGRF